MSLAFLKLISNNSNFFYLTYVGFRVRVLGFGFGIRVWFAFRFRVWVRV